MFNQSKRIVCVKVNKREGSLTQELVLKRSACPKLTKHTWYHQHVQIALVDEAAAALDVYHHHASVSPHRARVILVACRPTNHLAHHCVHLTGGALLEIMVAMATTTATSRRPRQPWQLRTVVAGTTKRLASSLEERRINTMTRGEH